jgi:hypothetical protein
MKKVQSTKRRKNMEEVKRFFWEEDAVSTVEIVLIVIVLIGLVVLFKSQIVSIVQNILDKATNQSNEI